MKLLPSVKALVQNSCLFIIASGLASLAGISSSFYFWGLNFFVLASYNALKYALEVDLLDEYRGIFYFSMSLFMLTFVGYTFTLGVISIPTVLQISTCFLAMGALEFCSIAFKEFEKFDKEMKAYEGIARGMEHYSKGVKLFCNAYELAQKAKQKQEQPTRENINTENNNEPENNSVKNKRTLLGHP